MGVGKTGLNTVDALLNDKYWNNSGESVSLTYSLDSTGNDGLDFSERIMIREALKQWSQVANISFREVSTGGNLRFAGEDGLGGHATYKTARKWWGGKTNRLKHVDIKLGKASPTGKGNRFLEIALHEIGHALGLKHPGNYNFTDGELKPGKAPFLPYFQDNTTNTLMSYNGVGSYAGTPMPYDIRAVQHLYGAKVFNSGNTTYRFSTVHSHTNGYYGDRGNPNKRMKLAIWDSGGVDTLDFSKLRLDRLGYQLSIQEGGISTAKSALKSEYQPTDSNRDTSGLKYYAPAYGTAIAYGAIIENVTGSSSNDDILGNNYANVMRGGKGDDLLDGNGGNDTLYGDQGNDSIYADEGHDRAYGGAGNDFLAGWSGNDHLYGDDGDDRLYGDDGHDRLYGGKGNDRLWGESDNASFNHKFLGGNDYLSGGDGNDRLYGVKGNDSLHGDSGNDYLSGGVGRDSLYGGSGNDSLYGGQDNDTLVGSTGNDYLNGGSGNDAMYGGAGNDYFVVDSSQDRVIEYSNQGTDTVLTSIHYRLGNNVENLNLTGINHTNGYGNSLNNVISGNSANNHLWGMEGNDTINGGRGDDVIHGDSVVTYFGNQYRLSNAKSWTGAQAEAKRVGGNLITVNSASEQDWLAEVFGRNELFWIGMTDRVKEGQWKWASGEPVRYTKWHPGEPNDDRPTLTSAGEDYAATGWGDSAWNDLPNNASGVRHGIIEVQASVAQPEIAGNDVLRGGAGWDQIFGGGGNDILVGGAGNDVLTGGKGADKFAFNSVTEGIDQITDFLSFEGDKIQILARGFGGGLSQGFLSASQFILGSQATDSNDRFLFNRSTGSLAFDVDGSGSRAAVQIAQLNAGVTLTSNDILIV